ncbi:MAG: porin, partial [Phycisphaerae bacterium]|nr:porin [Phycisphaerae bacterium]
DTYNGGAQKGRLAWVGLKGGFGSVTIGSQWSPYYNVAGRADIFNDAGWYAYYQGPFRIKNSVVYGTPDSISSFKGEVAAVVDGETDIS